ncbi:MAG: glutamine-hydrolyzing carbamoyl-phosphate synthase small subunit [Bdellovibrionales bacterium]|jgi:carbamoyl-phosphate synthase small subunit|nr:glutamine-hydrolyzing carbamoyl-phosphate synthase small subunit [Bdellovibrionales bacterium]
MSLGFLVLESGEVYEGRFRGGEARAGEVVFNTSHSGYEEIATDPSYYNQIVVMTAPMQGNYGVSRSVWESRKMWIQGFISLEMQESERDSAWRRQMAEAGIPILSDLDTREIVLRLRDQGTPWGAIVTAKSAEDARRLAQPLIAAKKQEDSDWVYAVSRREAETRLGKLEKGPRIAVLDFGSKENILRELGARASEIRIFPSRASASEIREWNPDGVMLTNGPGDPSAVQVAVETIRELLGWKPMFGICMGSQLMALALGAKTYKLKFGHRGSNHPVRDDLLGAIYVTSQNHGYAVDRETLPQDARVTHVNLNDNSVSGFECSSKLCFSVQYHPESHPGPHEAVRLFDYFTERLGR